ncbi:MAG: arginase family protein [Candidatus Aenigmarchaeota archaeon]|nr:arginase family protein [Candidatus Aenigmarchaeota archaeon]
MTRFFTDLFNEEEANVIFFGIKINKKSEQLLDSLRKTSWFVECFDVDSGKNLLENVKIYDIGNVNQNEITTKIKEITGRKKIPLMISQTHLSTLYAMKAFEGVSLIVFDAHCDLKNKYVDEKVVVMDDRDDKTMNCVTWLRRLVENRNLKVCLLGIRSCDEDEVEVMKNKKILWFTSNQIKSDIRRAKDVLRKFSEGEKIYLSIDVDCFDPSIAPAVHYLEPNGLSFREFDELTEAIKGEIVGIDLNSIACSNEQSEFVATKAILKALGKITLVDNK